MNDNLARVLVEENHEEYYRLQAQRAAQKAKAKKAETIRAVACVAIVFVLAFSVISRYMRINELEKQILTIEADVENIKNTNDQKEVMLENTMSLEEIENEARVRLGMNKPANNQIVYVSIQNQDAAHVVQN